MNAGHVLTKRIASLLGLGRGESTAPGSSFEIAAAHERAGRSEDAQAAYEGILAGDPRNAKVHLQSGLLAFRLGRLDVAASRIREALDLGETSPEAYASLGEAYSRLGRAQDAETVLARANDEFPDEPGLVNTLGLARLRNGDTAGAIATLAAGVAAHPANADLLNNLGGLYKDAGCLDEAIAQFRAALAVQPRSTAIWLNLAASQMAARQWDEAEANFRSVLLLDDRLPDAWSGVGSALAQKGRYDEAEQACREAVALRPQWAKGHLALGSVLTLRGDLDAAERGVREAIRLDAADPDLWLALASIGQARGDTKEADRRYRRAIEVGGASPKPHYDYGLFLLSQGDYLRGFDLLESRFSALPGWYTRSVREIGTSREPWRWRGGPIEGRSLLVIGEQGFGDHVMMLRYFATLKKLGARRIALACTQPLVRLARLADGVDEVVEVDSDDRVAALLAARSYDLYCPLMSLPGALRVTRDRIDGSAYLRVPDAVDVAAGGDALKVGLVWAGNSTQDDPQRRVFSLTTLTPLLGVAGVRFVSLQKQAAQGNGIPSAWKDCMVDPMDACADFLDTAGILAGLDLVISVDTAVAHLAGALGIPTWIVLKHGGEWRWGAESLTSPWYSSMRIFRQQRAQGWSEVVESLRIALAERAA